MYTASSPQGPWTSQVLHVTGQSARGLVDASPILMPDGRVLMYYLMSFNTEGDPASSQPNNEWKIGVAESTDNGVSFRHRTVAYTGRSSTTDPFPLLLASGLLRLYMSPANATVLSVTSTDSSGFAFAAEPDPGLRVTTGGVPGALRVGSTYLLYVGGIRYFTSSDGLNFTFGGSTGLTGGSPSPIDAGDGTFLMSYICTPDGPGTDPASHRSCIASSTDGRTWTRIAEIGRGSVPGLVKTRDGMLRVYVPAD